MTRFVFLHLFPLVIINITLYAGAAEPSLVDHLASFNIQSYGHFKQMVHEKKTEGVVSIEQAVSSNNTYAVGAIENGRGEITVLNNEVWLDYGEDGPGQSVQEIPLNETAVLLVTVQIVDWHHIVISEGLSKSRLEDFILEQAGKYNIDTRKPFPFLLEGTFANLDLHVLSGRNEKFTGHGGGEKLYKQHTFTKRDVEARILGFYSVDVQGVYTHPGESWHLHAVIEDDQTTTAHVDGINVRKKTVLHLPTMRTILLPGEIQNKMR